MQFDQLYSKNKNIKSRERSITVITDDGFSKSYVKDFIETSGEFIDFVKLHPGNILSKSYLNEKINIYKNANIEPFFSGALFESAYVRNKLDEYKKILSNLGISYIKISNSIVDITAEEKCELIKKFAKDFKVISEVGAKQNNVFMSYSNWRKSIKDELGAGSWKVIIEGGEIGTSGVNDESGEPSRNLVNEISYELDKDSVIWETSTEYQQLWFINQFGTGVNLANLHPEHVLKLESIRVGLHSDTFFSSLPFELKKGRLKKIDPMYDIDFQI